MGKGVVVPRECAGAPHLVKRILSAFSVLVPMVGSDDKEELVIKALDDHLVATDLVSGASILGDGRVVLILNIATVIARLARRQKTLGATA